LIDPDCFRESDFSRAAERLLRHQQSPGDKLFQFSQAASCSQQNSGAAARRSG
jgi:hypothetical protein